MVAGENAPRTLDTVRLPAGSAVWTNVSMTASRTSRSRSVRGIIVQVLSVEQFTKLLESRSSRGRAYRATTSRQPSAKYGRQPVPPTLRTPTPNDDQPARVPQEGRRACGDPGTDARWRAARPSALLQTRPRSPPP